MATVAKAHQPKAGPGQYGAIPGGVLSVQFCGDGTGDVAGVQGVRLGPHQVHQTVLPPDAVCARSRARILPGEARAAQDPEDLLLAVLDVGGSRPRPGSDPDQLHPHGNASRRPAQVEPLADDVAGLMAGFLDAVPVGDPAHAAGHYPDANVRELHRRPEASRDHRGPPP